MPRYPGFVGPSYRSQSPLTDTERLINWYVQRIGAPAAKAPLALHPTPGVEEFLTIAQAPGRGLFAENGRCLAVTGPQLDDVLSGRTSTNRGAVLQDGSPVTMVSNGDGGGQVMITSAGQVYIFDRDTNVLTPVAVPGFSLMGAMLSDRFLVLDTSTSTLRISDVLNGLVFDPTQITQRSAAPDPWRALLVSGSRIWLFGEALTDIWYDTGANPFPFAPIEGATIEYGIGAPFTACEFGGTVAWLAQNKNGARVVVRATGYSSAEVISDEAFNFAMSQYTRVDDAEAFVYQELGVEHYVISFPSQNATWGFTDAGGWHERGTWNVSANRYDAWHVRNHAYAFDQHLVADRATGTVYRMSAELGLDAGGVPLRRERIGPGLLHEQMPFEIRNFALYLQNGVGLVTGQGSDPTIGLRVSKNGGRTFGPERRRSAGGIGDFKHKVVWGRLGQADDFVPKIVVSDPVPWRITDAFFNVPVAA